MAAVRGASGRYSSGRLRVGPGGRQGCSIFAIGMNVEGRDATAGGRRGGRAPQAGVAKGWKPRPGPAGRVR